MRAWLPLLLVLTLGTPSPSPGADDPAAGMEYRCYYTSATGLPSPHEKFTQETLAFLYGQLAEGKKIATSDLADPFATDDAKNPDLTPRKTTQDIFEERGIHFPEGAGAFYSDPYLIIRNTPENLELVDFYNHRLIDRFSRHLTLQIHLIEVPLTRITTWMETSRTESDHSTILTEAEQLVETGEGKTIVLQSMQTRSGQRASIESGGDITWVHGYSATEENGLTPDSETRFVGTSLEFDPVIGNDGVTIDLVYAFEHHRRPPEHNRLVVTVGDKDGIIDQPTFFVDKVVTAETYRDGQVRMVGIFKAPAGEGSDTRRRVLFLRPTITVSEAE